MKVNYEKLRWARLRANMTLQQLSKASGVSYPHLSEVINGKADITVAKLCAVAHALGVKPEDLYDCEVEK